MGRPVGWEHYSIAPSGDGLTYTGDLVSSGRIRIHTAADPAESKRWSAQLVDAGQDYLAAIVAEGEDWETSVRRWPVRAEHAD